MLNKKEEKILSSIHIASENDPTKPEFPADNPKFPATPTYRIKVHGFSNVWWKDESHNPTGTHKDRMAWEIVVTYHDFLMTKKRGQIKGPFAGNVNNLFRLSSDCSTNPIKKIPPAKSKSVSG